MKKIFVYGTLKKEYHNHSMIEKETFISRGLLSKENRFKMVSMGSFPAIIPTALANEAQDIEGEIWEISDQTFKSVDTLEGFPTFYWRDQFNINTNEREHYLNEQQHLCWVWFLQHKKAKNMDLPEIPGRLIVNY